MRTQLRHIGAPLALAVAGLALLVGAMAATNATPQAQALTNCSVSDYSLDSEELALLSLINNYRQSNGLNTLTVSTNLNRAAHWMAWDLGTTPNWSHTDSLGRSPYQRALDCGYPQGAGENLAAGNSWSTAQQAFDAWKASTGHNANMLNSYYKQIGIARVHVSGSPYGWYWVTKFGATDDGTSGGGGSSTPTNTPTPQPTAMPTNTPVPTQAFNPPPTSTPTQPPPTSTPTPAPTNTPPPTNTPVPPTPTPTPNSPSDSLGLQPGANLIGWSGNTTTPRNALRHVEDQVRAVYSWDAASQRWLRYGPQLPSYANTLTWMRQGEAYWIVTR